jgi:hypothetical protein
MSIPFCRVAMAGSPLQTPEVSYNTERNLKKMTDRTEQGLSAIRQCADLPPDECQCLVEFALSNMTRRSWRDYHPDRLFAGELGFDPPFNQLTASSAASSLAPLVFFPSYQNRARNSCPETVTLLDHAVRPPGRTDPVSSATWATSEASARNDAYHVGRSTSGRPEHGSGILGKPLCALSVGAVLCTTAFPCNGGFAPSNLSCQGVLLPLLYEAILGGPESECRPEKKASFPSGNLCE